MGVLIGHLSAAPDHPDAADQAQAGSQCEPSDTMLEERQLRADVRRILREELAAVSHLAAPAPAMHADALEASEASERDMDGEQVDQAVTQAQQEAAAQGQQVVHAALAQGEWTEQDVIAMRLALHELRPEERDALLGTLIPAINSGKVKLNTPGQIF